MFADTLPPFRELLARNPQLRIDRDDYNINVTANYGASISPQEVLALCHDHEGTGQPAHLYFHIPLCSYLCHFCNYVKDLVSAHGDQAAALDRWTTALITESRWWLERIPWQGEASIESMYLGGGTAALLGPSHLRRIMEHVRAWYALTDDCEITLEGNPDNFSDPALVAAALDLGFNRFSVGVQSFQEEVNQFTNRRHSVAMSLHAIENLVRTGVPFNVDMMFGLPYQTPESVHDDISRLVDLGVPTITIYRLRNADRASMGIGNRAAWNIPAVRERLDRRHVFPTLDATYEMRDRAVHTLVEGGYWPSPCGWWSRAGTYAPANIPRVSHNKWQRHDTMIARGPGAYGWITGGAPTVLQTHNTTDMKQYLALVDSGESPVAAGRLLTGHQAVAAALGFAYKANQPIEVARFRQQFGVELLHDQPYCDVISELLDRDLIRLTGDRSVLCPTLEGEALHEEIISIYFHERIGAFAAPVCNRFTPMHAIA